MNVKRNKPIFYALIIAASFFLSPVAYAGTDNAGIVLFTAIQRSKIKQQPTKLSFGCETNRGLHELYVFNFYAHSLKSPFGTAKTDEKGIVCDPITLQELTTRHSTSCLAQQVQWAQAQAQKTLGALPQDKPFKVRMSVTSQTGETHWNDNWGAYLLGLFSFVSESHAEDVGCDLKVSLELQESTGNSQFVVHDQITYSEETSGTLRATAQD